MAKSWSTSPAQALRVGPGFDLAAVDLSATPGWEHDEDAADKRLLADGEHLSEDQERLFAHGRSGGTRSVLLVLQGMDTAGKGGIVRHVLGLVDPQGVQLRSFGVPTEKERSQHYLQRIREALPTPGRIGVFDRSHYEDVLVVRVNELVPREVWEPRYDEINAFEREVVDAGTVIVKVALLVSPGRAEGPAARAPRAPRQVLEVQPGGHRRAREVAARTRRRTRRCSTARAPSTRPGTRCPRTTSGTRGWPSVACCATRSRGWTSTGRRPTSTSRPRRRGWTPSRLSMRRHRPSRATG